MKLRADCGDEVEDITMYRKMVGSLIYMTITRSDLSYVVGLVSQFMQSPHAKSTQASFRCSKKDIEICESHSTLLWIVL